MILQNDTTANTLAVISGSSAVISFVTAWQPLLAFGVAIIGCISGVMAIIYYYKKINE
jgi:membrane associated rhomboid family serine protease